MKAGLRVTRNAAATAAFSNRPAFSCSRPRPDAGAQEQSRAARIELQAESATSSARSGTLGEEVEEPGAGSP